MGNYKAPRVDGFQAIFYKSQREVVGESFCSLIRNIFENPSTIAELNHPPISFIPQQEYVTSIKHFRPISLCNLSYKTVTNILSTRLRMVIEELVDPCQCSFIPNRNSRNNIIIVQEVIHSMKNKNGQSGWIAIKVDQEKTYDRLNWDFVVDTLRNIGLPNDVINLVRCCM